MTRQPVTAAEIERLYPKVAEIISDALGVGLDRIRPDVSLIEELDAESIDFLDLVFRLERAFDVKIPRGQIVEDARGDLPEADFEQKGLLTEAGLHRLQEFLSEVRPDRFRSPLRSADIPRLFTPETFCKVVLRAQRAARVAA
jgi:acyl carrier protein